MNDKYKGLLLAVLGPLLWGCSGVVAQNLFEYHHLNPTWLVSVRMFCSGILLLGYGMTSKQRVFSIFKNKSDTIHLLLFSILGMTFVQLAYFMAISTGNAATATILQYLSPVIIIIYLAIKTLRLPQRIDSISVIVAILGTILLVTQGDLGTLSIPLDAVIWGILSAIAAAIYMLMPKALLKKYGSIPIVGWAMLIGGIIVGLYYQVWDTMPRISFAAFIEIIFVVIFGTMLAYLFFLQSLTYISATQASVLGSVEPLSATILGILFLNISFNVYGILGIVMIIEITFLQFMSSSKIKK